MGTSLQRTGRMRQRTVKWRLNQSDIRIQTRLRPCQPDAMQRGRRPRVGPGAGPYASEKLSRPRSAQTLANRVARQDGVGDDVLWDKGGELTTPFENASVD